MLLLTLLFLRLIEYGAEANNTNNKSNADRVVTF